MKSSYCLPCCIKRFNMRKLFAFLICFLAAGASMAQGLKIGVKAGADLSKMDAVGFDDGFTFGYHAGGFAEIKLSSKLSLQPEVYFSQQNLDTAASFSQVYQGINVSAISLKRLNIPILLSYKIGKGIALQAGPQFGILMSQGGLVKNGEDAFKKGDFSMVGGLQLNLGSFVIYGRYVVGLSDVQNIDVSDITNTDSWKSQAIHLGIGLALF